MKYHELFDHLGQPLPSNEPWQVEDLIICTASAISSVIFLALLFTGN